MKHFDEKGFTLVEVMIVIAIIGMLAIVGVRVMASHDKAMATKEITDVNAINANLKIEELMNS